MRLRNVFLGVILYRDSCGAGALALEGLRHVPRPNFTPAINALGPLSQGSAHQEL